MTFAMSESSMLSSLNRSFAEVDEEGNFQENGLAHAPKPEPVTDLFKFFGGRDLESESDISDDGMSYGDAFSLSESQSDVSKCTQESQYKKEAPISPTKAFFILFKGFVSIGVLFLPAATSKNGWLSSIILMCALTFFVIVGLRLLLRARQGIGGSYAELGKIAFGVFLRFSIEVLLVIGQLAYGTTYAIYIIKSVVEICEANGWKIERIEWIAGGVLFLILGALSWVRRLGKFAIIFGIASVLMLLCLLGMMGLGLFKLTTNSFAKLWPDSGKDLFRFIGIGLFSFEGYGIVIPASHILSIPQKFPKILTCCISCVSIFYILFSLYLANMCSLPSGEVISFSVLKVIAQNYPVAAYLICVVYLACLIPSYILVSHAIGTLCWRKSRYCITILLKCVTAAVIVVAASFFYKSAAEIPMYAGFFVCTPLILIIPSMLHLKLAAEYKKDVFLDVLVVSFGIFIMAAGVFTAVYYEILHLEQRQDSFVEILMNQW